MSPPPSFACSAQTWLCSNDRHFRCSSNGSLIRVKCPRTGDFPRGFGAVLLLCRRLGTRERGRLAVWLASASALQRPITPLEEGGRKSNVWIIHRGSEKRSSRPISGSSVATVTLTSLIHGSCLGCSPELAAEWQRVTCLPGNSETNSLESQWEMCLVTLLDVRWFRARFPLQSKRPRSPATPFF